MSHIKNIEKFVPDLKSREILDLGCGRGSDLIDFLKHGYRAVGLDKNAEYLVAARNRAKEAGVHAELYQGEC